MPVTYAARWSWPTDAPREDPGAQAIRSRVAAFERLAREHPNSPLADDGARAADWWRQAHPQAFAATDAATAR